jgi:hypothetical protein
MKVGIEFLNSDLNVDNMNDINFFVVHVLGILNEKDFDEEKCNKTVNSDALFNSALFMLSDLVF